MTGVLMLESLTRGNTLKQGDKTPLTYKLLDADGDNLNVAGKTAIARLVHPNYLSIGYEKSGLLVSQDDTVTFTIDNVIPARKYNVEIIVDNKFVFPSRSVESKFTIDKSTLGTEASIIEIVGVDAVVRKTVDLLNKEIGDGGVGIPGPQGPKGDIPITYSATPPLDTDIMWVDETEEGTGDSSVEVEQARVDVSGHTNATLKERLDKEHTEVTAQLAQMIEHNEIEPESLRESALETDGTLLQKAIDLVNEDVRKTKSIKLGRMYEIEKTIHVGTTISYRNQPWLIIRGSNGGLKLAHDGYMFDGDNHGGGLVFDKVKFEGTEDYKHPLMNGTHLIQINFTQCQFYSTRTIIDSTDYLQSIRFTQCNFKQMKDYQIKCPMVADMHLLNNVVEWGQGGLLLLTQDRTDRYSGSNLVVKDNVIEGISGQIPISTTHLSGAVFDSNYFEGNELADMDLTGGALPHRGLTITNNNFGGHAQYTEKTAGIKVGELHPTQGYNFSGNTCESVLFDFSESGSPTSIDLTGGQFRNNGNINYIGVPGSGPENSNTTIGSNVSSTSFWRGDYDKDAPSQTLNITIPRTGTYLMTTRALYGGDPDVSIHETVLLISEGRDRAPLRKTVSLSKEYHGLDESTNDLDYVFQSALNIDVIYTHPPAPVTRLDVTIVPITSHLPI